MNCHNEALNRHKKIQMDIILVKKNLKIKGYSAKKMSYVQKYSIEC